MEVLLKQDNCVKVTLEEGIVRKVVCGKNHSRLSGAVTPEEMVNREIRALELLAEVEGIQRFVRRESSDTFYTTYMAGVSLMEFSGVLPHEYFDRLQAMVMLCQEKGVYRIGHHRSDFIIRHDGSPGIIDFGNIIFTDDLIARIPGLLSSLKIYSALRVRDLAQKIYF